MSFGSARSQRPLVFLLRTLRHLLPVTANWQILLENRYKNVRWWKGIYDGEQRTKWSGLRFKLYTILGTLFSGKYTRLFVCSV
jgi:hypothetical protein